MTDLIENLTSELQEKINAFSPKLEVKNVGYVLETGDGIAMVSGLANVQSQELVQFENGVMGIAFNLESERVGVTIVGDFETVSEGMQVTTTGRIASVPVGKGVIGRVVNALGEPIDGKGPIAYDRFRPIERIAPGVVERQDVDTPVQTGIKAIDSMIPLGRGQRELIIGDRQTGKTAIAIDTIINQVGKDLICIYVAIGQKKAAIARTIGILEKHGAMDHTIIVVASADDPAAMQFIAPYAGCAIGEEFMDNGQDALIIYDDLSKHAWAYREISLILRRPPGREAFPGDVFYLHSRLLERASRMAVGYAVVDADYPHDKVAKADLKEGLSFVGTRAKDLANEALKEHAGMKVLPVAGTGGSLTALPIIETLLGDVSAYIPTNVISITDGQIYLESNLFNAGIRPGINVGISVSRVGSSAQTKAMKKVAGRLRLDMAAYRDLAAFAQFGSDLDKATMAQLNKGTRLQELLKQPQYEPVSLANQVALLYAGVNGFLDTIQVKDVTAWQAEFTKFLDSAYPEVLSSIENTKTLSPETEQKLADAINSFNAGWKPV
ncbi:MAG TPA: F0F1 ATP synthase subunit alpha [Bellilinea sp.]|nr:F0F1 ATP synthase subunit alpha [Bellilinea sp.]